MPRHPRIGISFPGHGVDDTISKERINEAVAIAWPVGRYDDIRETVRRSPGPFAVMNCICKQGKDLVGEPFEGTEARRDAGPA